MGLVNLTIQNWRKFISLPKIRNWQNKLLSFWLNQRDSFFGQQIVPVRLFWTTFFLQAPVVFLLLLVEWRRLPGIFLHKYQLGRIPKSSMLDERSSWLQDRGFVNIEATAWWVFWAPISWNGECEWYQDEEAFVCHETLCVPDPETRFTAPLLHVVNEENLEADVGDARETPENHPGHRLLEGEHISTITTDATHLSKWTMVANKLALLNMSIIKHYASNQAWVKSVLR